MANIKDIKVVEKEAQKSAEDRAEDVAYTINHAIACSVTDFMDPFVNKWVQDKIGQNIHIGCGHAHDHDHMHHHGSLMHSLIGEVVGDFVSVPITIAAQRFAPSFMSSLRSASEPFIGQTFHASAERSALNWAARRGIAYNSEAYNQRVEDIYNHEMDHLPQAMLWTISSVGINAATQRWAGNTHSPVTIVAGKVAGTALSTSLVIGARLLAPKSARSWDKFTSKNIIIPTTKFVAGALGIDDNVVDKVVEREQGAREGTWEERVRHSAAKPEEKVQTSVSI
jgi:hypothetical protein